MTIDHDDKRSLHRRLPRDVDPLLIAVSAVSVACLVLIIVIFLSAF